MSGLLNINNKYKVLAVMKRAVDYMDKFFELFYKQYHNLNN